MLVFPAPLRRTSVFDFTAGVFPDDAKVVRASTATSIGSTGLITLSAANLPRYDLTSTPAVIVEPAATNYATQSQDMSAAVWGKISVTVTTNDRISPDGTKNASKLVADPTQAYYQFFTAVPAGTPLTLSAWVYSATAVTYQFGFYDNILAGQYATQAIPANVWTRVSVSRSFGATASDKRFQFFAQSNATIWFWGAQVELGTVATSYIPTAGAQVTRAADQVVLNYKERGTNDGTINVRYFFGDGTTQDGTLVVSAGKATLPTDLNRRSVRKVALL